MSDNEKIETYDAKNNVGIASGKPPTAPQGPRRRAPRYYAGETYGRRARFRVGTGGMQKGPGRSIQHRDVERYKNGTVVGIRNKAARRLIRYALKRKFSSVERGLKLPRGMMSQATDIVREASAIETRDGKTAWKGKSPRAAQRLLAAELAIHQPVYAPSQKELRAMRTVKRKEKRTKAKANKKMLKGITAL